MTPTLAEILDNIDCIEQLPAESIGPLLAQLAALQGQLAARLIQSRQSERNTEPTDDCQLMTVEAAANRLAFTKGRLYALIRANRFPVIREGKQIRIRPSDLKQWIDKKCEKELDSESYATYNSDNDKGRASGNSEAIKAYSERTRGPRRSCSKLDSAAGAGRNRDSRTAGSTDSTPR